MALSRQARAGNCSDQQSVVRIGKAQFGRLTFRIESSSRAAVTGIIEAGVRRPLLARSRAPTGSSYQLRREPHARSGTGERQFSHRPASVNDAAIGERERIGLLLCFGLRHS
jgi:hypothetical protein